MQAIGLLLVAGAIFSSTTNGGDNITSAGWAGVVVYIVTIIVHEIIHGIGFLAAGASPKFGVGLAGILPIAYATSDRKISLARMLMIAYLPLVVLSAVFIIVANLYPEYQAIAMIGFIGNFTGAVGDIWIASKLWKYIRFRNVYILDCKAGVEVYSDDSRAAEKAKTVNNKASTKSDFGKHWAISAFVLLSVQLFAPLMMKGLGFRGDYRLGVEPLYLFELHTSPEGVMQSASFNLLAPLVIGLLFAIAMKAVSKRFVTAKN